MLTLLPNRQNLVNSNFAYLALAHRTGFDEICHMDKTRPNRIREIRDSQDMTLEDLAEATGLSASYVQRLESGDRNLSVKNMNLFAHALKVEPRELLHSAEERKNVVAVMGRIGAGAEITPDDEQIPPEGLYEIETPFPIPDDAIAFEVVGESMWPRYDEGDIIICWRQGVRADEVVGWEAAVKTSTGSRYLKRVLRGSTPDTFDLESHNAPPIRGVHLIWIASIQSVIRSGQWRKLSAADRHKLVKRMTRSA
jgi:transcriptional regulator with XRE-family HTH domain